MNIFTAESNAEFVTDIEQKELLDKSIGHQAETLLQEAKSSGPSIADAAAVLAGFMQNGGKRLRGRLLTNTYIMLGGQNTELCIEAAGIMELIHDYLLIMDDICDQSRLRRSRPAVHIEFEAYHLRKQLRGSQQHFGEAMAINTGLLACHKAMLTLACLPVDDSVKQKMIELLNRNLIKTVYGQMGDLMGQAYQDFNMDRVLQMLTNKTAYYSFLCPLQLGAVLAGAGDNDLESLAGYSMNMGLAYQIRDDIIGVFGEEIESGKSSQDDLREGKITILITHAMDTGSQKQQKRLKQILGNQDITDADIADARQILRLTGSLEYAASLVNKYARSATAVAFPGHWAPKQVDFMCSLAKTCQFARFT